MNYKRSQHSQDNNKCNHCQAYVVASKSTNIHDCTDPIKNKKVT